MSVHGEGSNTVKTSSPLRFLARLFGVFGLLCLVSACTAFEPIEPPKPAAKDFSADASTGALNRAKAAEQAGNWDLAAEQYREAAARWPVQQEAWSGLARAAMARGDGTTLALARFFEDRVVDADTMHPRQARMTFVNARENPPADNPAVGEWSKRMVAFFEYKDDYIRRQAYDNRVERSQVERYAIYPVAVGSVTAGFISLGSVFSDLGGSGD